MTAREAMHEAQRAHPLDLAARVAFIIAQIDDPTGAERGAWIEAHAITRNGGGFTMPATDYHRESRISNENYKLELAVQELAALGLGRQEIIEMVDDKLETIDDEANR